MENIRNVTFAKRTRGICKLIRFRNPSNLLAGSRLFASWNGHQPGFLLNIR